MIKLTTIAMLLASPMTLASGPSLAAAEKATACDPLHLIPNCISPAGPISPDLANLWAQITNAVQADLVYAKALADSANTPGSKLRSQCLGAVIEANKQASGANLNMAVPDPHVVTDVEKLAELIDNLQPTAPVISQCAAAANALKVGVVQFMSTMLVGITKVVPLIP